MEFKSQETYHYVIYLGGTDYNDESVARES